MISLKEAQTLTCEGCCLSRNCTCLRTVGAWTWLLLSPTTKRRGLATIQLSSTLLKSGFEGPVRPF
eukprot:6208590-Pleurochrysis_carterae.AAC.2